jgi:hypothetical protein
VEASRVNYNLLCLLIYVSAIRLIGVHIRTWRLHDELASITLCSNTAAHAESATVSNNAQIMNYACIYVQQQGSQPPRVNSMNGMCTRRSNVFSALLSSARPAENALHRVSSSTAFKVVCWKNPKRKIEKMLWTLLATVDIPDTRKIHH